jgi:hypothetical protein
MSDMLVQENRKRVLISPSPGVLRERLMAALTEGSAYTPIVHADLFEAQSAWVSLVTQALSDYRMQLPEDHAAAATADSTRVLTLPLSGELTSAQLASLLTQRGDAAVNVLMLPNGYSLRPEKAGALKRAVTHMQSRSKVAHGSPVITDLKETDSDSWTDPRVQSLALRPCPTWRLRCHRKRCGWG